MAYRFKLTEPVAAGASRIGLEQIDFAEARLTSHDDTAAAIHDARRCLKRLRALLRLIRPGLAESAYRREADRLAGVGRLLAEARDQHVMQQTLTKLESRFGSMPKEIAGKLAKLAANGAAGGGGSQRQGIPERSEVLGGLEASRAFLTRLARRPLSFDHLAAGVERSYRRARRAFRDAYETPTNEAFHEWRKAVQQHWRHMQLISRAWPEVLAGRASEAKELSRLLGEDHDVHVLLNFATDKGSAVFSPDELRALAGVGRSVQDEMRAEAKPRGLRLFAEPAGNLRERMESYWSAACDLSAVSSARQEEKAPAPKKAKRPARGGSVAHAASRGLPSPARRSGR